MVDDAGADGDIDASSDAGTGVGDDGDTLRPSSKGLETLWFGGVGGAAGGCVVVVSGCSTGVPCGP